MPKKILIIEDEEILLNILKKKLIDEKYEVLTALDGEEGLQIMKEKKPDLILLDILMPKKNGFEVMEEMIKDPELKNIPIIIVSNSGQPVELERAKSLGAKDCLVKTEFDPQEVIDKVREQIGE
ncbi:MAG: Response regulator receiver protein [Parcubacteria group bacterium GW2011_GWF2_39_13b]|nr:MAG: Response regulator receiver protein [Parcubacteria group bacterium GW2011_GWF2_39_13b]